MQGGGGEEKLFLIPVQEPIKQMEALLCVYVEIAQTYLVIYKNY